MAIGLSVYGCIDTGSTTPEAQLSSLTVDPGALAPAFSSGTTRYDVKVSTTDASITVTATPQDSDTTMTINGAAAVSGQGRSVTLDAVGSPTTIPILLTAPSGTQNTYFLVVHRLSDNNNLSTLTVTGQRLDPEFRSSTVDYRVNVASDISSVTITATLADPNASMTINNTPTSSGVGRDIGLGDPESDTGIAIMVTAPIGASKTYRITVRRAASSNSNLSGLSVTTGAITPAPFDPNQKAYTVIVGFGVTSVTVTATKSDLNATMSARGSVIAAPGVPTGQVSDIPVSTTESILVVAPDGISRKTYTITVSQNPPINR
jgi:hypothetical protein